MAEPYAIFKYVDLSDPCVTAGDRACLIGTQDGLFPDMGRTIPGEMGGLWAGDLKLCDGFFLAADDVPLRACDAFEARPEGCTFHYRLQEAGLHVARSQFIPDGEAACIVELTVENLRPTPRMAEISFTVRTDILPAPGARSRREPGRDVCEFDARTQAFYARDTFNPWHVCWGAQTDAAVLLWDMPREIYGFGNTAGRGVNGRLFYRLRLQPQGQATLRLFIAGGCAARSQAEDLLQRLRDGAQDLLPQKQARMREIASVARATLPDADIARAWNWACVNFQWLLRAVPGGRALCESLPEARGFFLGDDEEALAAMLPLGGAQTLEDALRLLRDASRRDEDAAGPVGCVVGGIAADGSALSAGNALTSARFVSLVWRVFEWTDDRAFLAEMMPFLVQCMQYVRRETRDLSDGSQVPRDLLRRLALRYASMLETLGYPDADRWTGLAEGMEPEAEQEPAPDAPLSRRASWHGERGHVEQMTGCVRRIAETLMQGMPGALTDEDAADGAFVQAKAPAGIVWPMTRYLFGLHPQSPRRTIRWTPHTPIGWDGWKLENLCVGDTRFTVESRRVSQGRAAYTIRASEPGWTIVTVQDGAEECHALQGELTLTMPD